jgi:hypothetical protein
MNYATATYEKLFLEEDNLFQVSAISDSIKAFESAFEELFNQIIIIFQYDYRLDELNQHIEKWCCSVQRMKLTLEITGTNQVICSSKSFGLTVSMVRPIMQLLLYNYQEIEEDCLFSPTNSLGGYCNQDSLIKLKHYINGIKLQMLNSEKCFIVRLPNSVAASLNFQTVVSKSVLFEIIRYTEVEPELTCKLAKSFLRMSCIYAEFESFIALSQLKNVKV